MFFKRQFPVYIMVTVGLLTLIGHFIKGGSIENFIQKDSLSWFNIIASFSILLGAFNLLKIHFQKFFKKQKDWQYSLIALIGFVAMIVAGFFFRGANYLKIEINDSSIKELASKKDNSYVLNKSLINEIDDFFNEQLISYCDNPNYVNSLSCYDNQGTWNARIVDPLEFGDPIYDKNNVIVDEYLSSEVSWLVYDFLVNRLKNENYNKIVSSKLSVYNLKNIINEDLLGIKETFPITDNCFELINENGTPFLKRQGYCDSGPLEDINTIFANYPDWRFFEKFNDYNGNGRIDIAEDYEDSNNNGIWDNGEKFTDLGNGFWDEGEEFTDKNGNGFWDSGELFVDLGNGKWDEGEEFLDLNVNGYWDSVELFVDLGNGKWDEGEEFTDKNGNGVWDSAEDFTDLGNGKWDGGERYDWSTGKTLFDVEFFFKTPVKNISFNKYLKSYFDSIEEQGIFSSKEFNRKIFSNSKLKNQVAPLSGLIKDFIFVESVDWGDHVTESGTFFKWLFDSAYSPIDMTMFALLAFFVASASYRAFRIRNFEASLLLLAGVLVMLGAVPIGNLISSWMLAYLFLFILFAFSAPLIKNKVILYIALGISCLILLFVVLILDISGLTAKSISTWIITYPTVAGKKAIMIGIALGIVATSLRIIFGRDKSFLGD